MDGSFFEWRPDVECIIRVDTNGDHVLLDRVTGVEYARGTDAQVRHAAGGVHTITDAPRLGPVQLFGTTPSGYNEFVQLVDETVPFLGRLFTGGVSEWTSGVLFPDHLNIGFAERLADVPQFIAGVQTLVNRQVSSVQGTASLAGIGDPPLLGDWLRAGRFQPDRLARRFEAELGGRWDVVVRLRYAGSSSGVEVVEFNRRPGS